MTSRESAIQDVRNYRQAAAERRQAAAESTSFSEQHFHESSAITIEKMAGEIIGNAGIIPDKK